MIALWTASIACAALGFSAPATPTPTPSSSASVHSRAQPVTGLERYRWRLQLQPGFEAMELAKDNDRADIGGGVRLALHAERWGGDLGRFLIGGGPLFQWGALSARTVEGSAGYYQPLTGGAEMIMGGGDGARGRWAVFARLGVSLGSTIERTTFRSDSFSVLAWRIGGGLGGYYRVHERVSLGAQLDVGQAFVDGDWSLWLNPGVSVAVHFGKY